MKSFLALAAALVFAGSAAAKDPKPENGKEKVKGEAVTHVDASGAAKLLAETDKAKTVIVLDIRTPVEFDEGHIEGAENIDFLDKGFEDAVAKLDREKPYLVHCGGGGRSGKSLAAFRKLGFKKVYHLDGGLSDWKKAGNPVVQAKAKEEKKSGE